MLTSLTIAAVLGFTHSFEADHLLAVSNIVTKRNRMILALKDGIFWGLGHTSTIIVVGLVIVLGKMMIVEDTSVFKYFESLVGIMLIGLGVYRAIKVNKFRQNLVHQQTHHHTHDDSTDSMHDHSEKHHLAYGVGLLHGLAGSGSVIISALATMQSNVEMLFFLVIFGIGSVVGMLLASGALSLPFSKKLSANLNLQIGLTLLSCILCIGFGVKVVMENLL